MQALAKIQDSQYSILSDLRSHRFLRHIVGDLSSHPFADDILSCHAAVITKGSAILATGINKPRTHGLVLAHRPHHNMTVHAEIDVLIKARKKHDLNGCSMYVARKLKKSEQLAMSKPCPTCHKILARYGVHHVYYTAGIGEIWYVDTREPYTRISNA